MSKENFANAALREMEKVYRQDLFMGFAIAGLLASGKHKIEESDPYSQEFTAAAGDLADRASMIAHAVHVNAWNDDLDRQSEARALGEARFADSVRRYVEDFDDYEEDDPVQP